MSRLTFLVAAVVVCSSATLAATSPTAGVRITAESPRVDRTTFHARYGTAEAVSGRFVIEAPGSRLDKALAFVAGRHEAFRLASPARELRMLSEKTDELGLTHLRFQQVYEGLRVWGCQTIVHFEDERTIYLAGGQTMPTPTVSTVPAISETGASSRAVAVLADQQLPAEIKTESELLIYPDDGMAHLAWMVTVTSPTNGTVRLRVFVDARGGGILRRYNDIHFDGPDVGSGPGVLGVNRVFPIYEESGIYKMINTTHNGDITTYENYYHGGPISTDPDGDKIWDDNTDQKAAVSGHHNGEVVYSYFFNTLGRDGYDGLGHDLLVNVHDPFFVNNAYWNGEGINFADGDGTNFLPFSGSLDVLAHEFTHAVTEYTAGLIYAFQSGALNEHFSDVFGVMVDRDDWRLGEDIMLAAPGYIRDMSNPTERGHPARMSDYLVLDYEADFGGVHINCGIPNHCLYWFVELGAGRDVAEQIWYRCLSTYLTPSSGFYFWAGMIFQSSRDLYGTLYDATLEQALGMVELNTVYAAPGFVDVTLPVGGDVSDTVWVHNPGAGSVDASAVAPSIPGMTVTELAGNHPTIPVGDSAAFLLAIDGSSLSECEIGVTHDTLRFDVDGYIEAQIKLPLSVTVGYAATSPQTESFATSCLTATSTNQAGMLDFGRLGQDALIEGSLLVGLMDGSTPGVYRSFYGVDRFPAADNFYSEAGLRSYRLASEDGRVLGSVEYTWDDTDPENCGFAIAKYTLRNPCDTPLTIHTGLIFDFDVIDGESNHVKYELSNQLVYMTDADNTYAVGLALLSGDARNLRAIYNPTQVDDGVFTDAIAYSLLNLGTNAGSPMPGDYSALMSIGEGLIGPDDSVVYKVALLCSPTGSDGLTPILEKAQTWASSCCKGVRGNANGDIEDKVNISDVSYLLAFLFGIPTGPEPACWEEASANGDIDEKVNVSDVSYLLAYLFGIPSGPEPPACP